MTRQFDIRVEDDGTHTVFDVDTQLPVVIDGIPQVGLDIQDAEDIAKSLNENNGLTAGCGSGSEGG